MPLAHVFHLPSRKHLKMKSYSIIDKRIKDYRTGKNKNTDIYFYGYLKLCSDFKTGVSHATQQKLHELTKIPLRTVQSIISRLKKTDLIYVQTKQVKIKRFNVYHYDLNPENYYYVDNRLYYTNIGQKHIGFLLLIKSLCLDNSNKTLYNRTKIAELLNQTRGTVSNMINYLIEKKLLLELDNGFQLPANYFPLYSKDEKSEQDYENFDSMDEFVLNSILDVCDQNNTVLFTPDLQPLKLIFAHYPFFEKDIKELNKTALETYYLPEVLKKRCTKLPNKIESLNYFLKALNVDYHVKENGKETILL